MDARRLPSKYDGLAPSLAFMAAVLCALVFMVLVAGAFLKFEMPQDVAPAGGRATSENRGPGMTGQSIEPPGSGSRVGQPLAPADQSFLPVSDSSDLPQCR